MQLPSVSYRQEKHKNRIFIKSDEVVRKTFDQIASGEAKINTHS